MPIILINPTNITPDLSPFLDKYLACSDTMINFKTCIDDNNWISLTHPLLRVDAPEAAIFVLKSLKNLPEGSTGKIVEPIGELKKINDVWTFLLTSSTPKVIKIFTKPSYSLKKISSEARRTTEFSSKLTASPAFFQEKSGAIIMDWAGTIDLFKFYHQHKPLPLQQILTIMRNICLDVDNLHHRGAIHRDIKLENIMIDPDNLEVTLIDFTFTRTLAKPHKKICRKGSLYYCPPESLVSAKSTGLSYEEERYAVGICFAFLCGEQSISGFGMNVYACFERTKKEEFQGLFHNYPIISQTIQTAISNLIKNLTRFNASKRISFTEAIAEINRISDMLPENQHTTSGYGFCNLL